jgi:hypothetical protein
MSFKDWLDKQELEAEKSAESSEDLPKAEENDPLARYIGRREERGLGEPSPFDLFLDEVEAQKPEGYVPPLKESEHHDWQIVRSAIYSEDHVVWMCSKCCRTVSVERDQTVKDALEAISVSPDCSIQLTKDVMEN